MQIDVEQSRDEAVELRPLELGEQHLLALRDPPAQPHGAVGEEREVVLRELAELERSELDGFVARLLDVDLHEAQSLRSGITGEWISQCGLRLALPDRPAEFYRYGRFDVLPHSLETIRQVLGDLETLARARAIHGELPKGYEPRLGDFVRRADGELFEVVGFTSDGRGVELSGINQPITLYIARVDFRAVFVSKEDRALLDLDR